MDIYLYSKRIDLAATTLADLNLLIAAVADETDADNQATIAQVTAKLETMVQADTGTALAIYSYDDAAGTVSSWITNAACTVEIGLGDPDPYSTENYAYTATTAIAGSSRTATLALNTQELVSALGGKIRGNRGSANFTLQIRKTESAVTKTVALISVEVAAGVISTLAAAINTTTNLGAARFTNLTHVNGATITDTGTGALALTASGTNQNITIKPSGTAHSYFSKVPVGDPVSTWLGTALPVLVTGGETGSGAGDLLSYFASDTAANRVSYVIKRSRGTLAAPTAVADLDYIGSHLFSAYEGTAFQNTANVGAVVDGTVSTGIVPSKLIFETSATAGRGTQAQVRANGRMEVGITGVTTPAWGLLGINFNSLNRTVTDSTSSGTVASAAVNSFSVVAIAASAATTFTNAATQYIAGAPTAGSNVILTNAYGLWNAGKTRLDGTLICTESATPASASAAGVAGTIAWDASYVYVCTATNTWKRTALTTW